MKAASLIHAVGVAVTGKAATAERCEALAVFRGDLVRSRLRARSISSRAHLPDRSHPFLRIQVAEAMTVRPAVANVFPFDKARAVAIRKIFS